MILIDTLQAVDDTSKCESANGSDCCNPAPPGARSAWRIAAKQRARAGHLHGCAHTRPSRLPRLKARNPILEVRE